METEEKQFQAENIKNSLNFSSYLECKRDQCRKENLREHFHCYDIPCSGKILNKKEEILRHIKWHKKRNESLNHGFLRFSSSDDCSINFENNYCQHNRKQTHYHCIQPNCDKIYISTSDVQMHSNYHRKNSAIYQEGFQRFRATEECKSDYCIFSGQRTTHFHCRRDNCRFTFKNKGDMEKHKSYHIKDLQLAQDGFKKFLKNELCSYEGCRFSNVCNHIHCVRENCFYVLHSSGQLISHKRKHDRLDGEQAYKRYKLLQKQSYNHDIINESNDSDINTANISNNYNDSNEFDNTCTTELLKDKLELSSIDNILTINKNSTITNNTESLPTDLTNKNSNSQKLYTNISPSDPAAITLASIKFLQQMQENHQKLLNQTNLNLNNQQLIDNNNLLISIMLNNFNKINNNIGSSSSSILHNYLNNFNDIDFKIRNYFTSNCTNQIDNNINHNQTLNLQNNNDKRILIECSLPITSTSSTITHLHCLYKDCGQIFKQNLNELIEHIQSHELHNKKQDNDDDDIEIKLTNTSTSNNLIEITSIDSFLNRKRGRPPKNRVVELYNNNQKSPEASLTSLKVEKNSIVDGGEQVQQISPSSTYTETFPNYYHQSLLLPGTTAVKESDINKIAINTVSQNVAINDDEKKSVVRAAGTYFPINTSSITATSTNPINDPLKETVTSNDNQIQENNYYLSPIKTPTKCKITKCNTSFSKRKRKLHKFCNQTFADIYKLKHSAAISKTLNQSDDDDEDDDDKISLINKDIKSVQDDDDDDDSYDKPENLLIPQLPSINLELKQSSSSVETSPTPSSYFNQLPVISPDKIQNIQQQQNLHLAQLALYQQTPSYYHQHLYTSSSSSSLLESSVISNCNENNISVNKKLSKKRKSSSKNCDNNNIIDDFLIKSKKSFKSSLLSSSSLAVPSDTIKGINNNQQSTSSSSSKQTSFNMKIFKDEPIPNGYLKFRFNEDCNFENCGYRKHQSHFHCTRIDCYYSFCDKTRFVQHTARHERLDKLMGAEFKQYRANMKCNYDGCVYNKNWAGQNNKSSHFHCLKCNFICSDTNKVVAHRRQHNKTEFIRMAGFRKISNNEKCIIKSTTNIDDDNQQQNDECNYSLKQTHYHCLVCDVVVLSRAQLSTHKHRTS